jgi:hypothetical protein
MTCRQRDARPGPAPARISRLLSTVPVKAALKRLKAQKSETIRPVNAYID